MTAYVTTGTGDYIINETSTATTVGTGETTLYTYNIPAGLLVNAGDSLVIDFFATLTGSSTMTGLFYVAATSANIINNSISQSEYSNIIVTRKDSSTIYVCIESSSGSGRDTLVSGTDSASGFTIKFTGTAAVGTSISAIACMVNLLKPNTTNSTGSRGSANGTNVAVVNTAGVYNDLHSYSIPANTLVNNGDYMEVFAHNTLSGSGASSLGIRLQVAGTNISVTPTLLSAGAFRNFIRATIVRIDSGTLCVRGFFIPSLGSLQTFGVVISTTVANAMTVKFTGESSSATGTITQNLSYYTVTRT